MNKNFIKINNKNVQISQPYNAAAPPLIGREQEMRKILAAWMVGNSGLPLSPLLLSEPGIGKNRITYEAARICGKELFVFQGHEEVTSDDLVCTVRFSDDPERKMDYILSPLATAMLQKNAICFIDEIAKIRPRALAPLASLLDERRYIDSSILGERIYASPGFRFIAASNTIDLEGNMFPDFIRSRMRPMINVGYPSKDEIDRIIKSRFQTLHGKGNTLLDLFWTLWRDRNGDKPPTPRDSIYIFGYALNLSDFEAVEGDIPCRLEGFTGDSHIREEHVEKAFAAFHDLPEGIG